jgi:hypothetical protein
MNDKRFFWRFITFNIKSLFPDSTAAIGNFAVFESLGILEY